MMFVQTIHYSAKISNSIINTNKSKWKGKIIINPIGTTQAFFLPFQKSPSYWFLFGPFSNSRVQVHLPNIEIDLCVLEQKNSFQIGEVVRPYPMPNAMSFSKTTAVE